MEDLKYNDSTRNRPDGERLLDAPAVPLNLNASIAQLKGEVGYHKNDRNAITLFHSERMRIVLIALHAGTEITEHAVTGPCSILTIDGRVEVRAGSDSFPLGPGEAVALQDAVPHSVRADGESVILLTLAAGKKESDPF
jgi:quercetin dioxygenase-like cupin family protein